jgi:hypothetical protein
MAAAHSWACLAYAFLRRIPYRIGYPIGYPMLDAVRSALRFVRRMGSHMH